MDAGGYGLTIIFAGVVAALRGEDARRARSSRARRSITHPQHASSTYRFCTNFAVIGTGLSASRFIAPLETLGDSVLVVGDASTLKVHLHTDEPERATAVFARAGEISRLDIADMRLQVAERDERLRGTTLRRAALHGGEPVPVLATPSARCGALVVVSGDGLQAMFGELGAYTIDGGPTLNPSTYELLAAIHEVPAEEVLVLPSSPNVVMAAERAAELSDKQVLGRARGSPAGGAGRRRRAGVRSQRGGERAGADRGAGARAHGRGRAGRPRRRRRVASGAARRSGSSPRRCTRGAIPRRRWAR